MIEREIRSILKLFKSYLDISNKSKPISIDIKNGLMIEGEPSPLIIQEASKLYSKTAEELNQTLHKSFSTVIDSSIEKLLVDQLLHYFSTYGLESLGIDNSEYIYIPYEKLDIPEIKNDIPLVFIHSISEEELQEKLMILLTSGIALSEETLEEIKILSKYIPKERFDEIKNREFKLYLYKEYNTVPRNPDMFMKYLLYILTDSTCFIYNQYQYKNNKISTKKKVPNIQLTDTFNLDIVYDLFNNYINLNNPIDSYKYLSTIFNKYKTVFMTLKSCLDYRYIKAKELRTIINKISKLSKTYNLPSSSNILDNILSKDILKYTKNEIIEKLQKISIYRELRLLAYIRKSFDEYHSDDNINLYRIRNRKIFAKPSKEGNYVDINKRQEIYNIIYEDLCCRIKPKVKGKTIYIPNYLNITCPTSEKQFIDNLPNKSYIQIERNSNLVIGIHWKNLPYKRVDLDLHMVNKTEQFGWSTSYRNQDKQIIYSGDMTNAKDLGASEYFLIRSNTNLNDYLLTINNFTQTYKEGKFDFDFIIAETDDNEIYKNYIIDPNKILVKMNRTMLEENGNQTCLGLLSVNEYNIKFYFTNFDMSNSGIVTKRDDNTKLIYQGLKQDLDNCIFIRKLLSDCEAILVDEPYKEEFEEIEVEGKTLYQKNLVQPDYNLSLENISKETIINIFKEER